MKNLPISIRIWVWVLRSFSGVLLFGSWVAANCEAEEAVRLHRTMTVTMPVLPTFLPHSSGLRYLAQWRLLIWCPTQAISEHRMWRSWPFSVFFFFVGPLLTCAQASAQIQYINHFLNTKTTFDKAQDLFKTLPFVELGTFYLTYVRYVWIFHFSNSLACNSLNSQME